MISSTFDYVKKATSIYVSKNDTDASLRRGSTNFNFWQVTAIEFI